MRQVTPRNADRVTNPVAIRAIILGVVGLAAVLGYDLNVSEEQAGALSDVVIAVGPVVLGVAGAVWGALRAREQVTPIGPKDTPRDGDGAELVRADGKPLYRHAVAREQLHERLTIDPPPEPRTDRRGIDRDPDRPR